MHASHFQSAPQPALGLASSYQWSSPPLDLSGYLQLEYSALTVLCWGHTGQGHLNETRRHALPIRVQGFPAASTLLFTFLSLSLKSSLSGKDCAGRLS